MTLLPLLVVAPGVTQTALACSVAYPENRRTMEFEGQAVSRSRMPKKENSDEFRGYLWTFKLTKWIKSSSGATRLKRGSTMKINVFERNAKDMSSCFDMGVEVQFQRGRTYRVGATKFPLRSWYIDNYTGKLALV
jgi:hypothetical protein